MCVASGAESGCWSGGGGRWGAAWWDHEQHLSPINSLYLSPAFCTVTTCFHRLAIWWLQPFLLHSHLFCENSLFLIISSSGAEVCYGRNQHFANVSIVTGLPYLSRMSRLFVSHFIVSGFVSLISPQPAVKWMNTFSLWSFWFCERERAEHPAKREHIAWKNNYFGGVAVHLFPLWLQCDILGLANVAEMVGWVRREKARQWGV